MDQLHCIRAGWLFDGSGGMAREDRLLTVKDGIIQSISKISYRERSAELTCPTTKKGAVDRGLWSMPPAGV